MVQDKRYQELTNAFIQHSLDFVFVGFVLAILALIIGIVEFYLTGQVPTGTNLMFLGLGTISIGVACLSLKIAKESEGISQQAKIIAEKSKIRMDAIGEAEIQQSIINLEEVRRKFQWEMDEIPRTGVLKHHIINRAIRTVEWTTWLNYQYLKKALKYKKYLNSKDEAKLLRYHQIIMKFILDKSGTSMKFNFVDTTHVHQLIMGCKILKKELRDIGVYEKKYRELLRTYITIKKEEKEFIKYLNLTLSD